MIAGLLLAALLSSGGDAARLRTELEALDYEAVMRDAEPILAAHPENSEVRALRVVARLSRQETVTDEAEWMVRAYPNDPWSWYGRAYARFYAGGDALADVEKAIALSPMPVRDFISLRGALLRSRGNEGVAYLDEQLKAAPNDPSLLVMRAQLTKGAEAMHAYEQALAAAPPNDVRIHRIVAEYLLRSKQEARAASLLLDAVHEYPTSVRLVQRYATALRGNDKQTAIDALLDPLLRVRGGDPDVLVIAAELDRSLEKLVDPHSPAGEALAFSAALRFYEEQHPLINDADFAKQEAAMFQSFIDRPCHDNASALQVAYQSVFIDRRRDPTFTNDQLRAAIRGMGNDDRNPNVAYFLPASELANRGIDFDWAMQLVERGAAVVERNYHNDTWRARMLDVRGWVALRRGDLAAATRDLEAAHKLATDDPAHHYHYGRLLEQRGDKAAAEREWARGISNLYAKDQSESYLALSAAYKAKHGGKLDGFDDYVKSLTTTEEAATRRAKILGERVKEPKSAPVFALKTLDGSKLSLDELRGKVVVVNFWGVWCGWCVAEMPELQKLVARYANDPRVRIVTIDNDEDLALVRKFMAEKHYEFPVLLDDGYVAANGVTGFPTTWFLDPQGRIAFDKKGANDKLQEEWSWRIEALKQ